MREFHHIGIPTETQHDNEAYVEAGKVHITDPDASGYRIEWLRFDADSPMPEQLKTTPHAAFMVDDLDKEIAGQDVLIPPFSPMEGLKVAFILVEGSPFELMQQG